MCVKLLYVKFVCVWSYCMLSLCVWNCCCMCEGGGGRRRSPGYRIKNKNPTQRCGEKPRVIQRHIMIIVITMIMMMVVLWRSHNWISSHCRRKVSKFVGVTLEPWLGIFLCIFQQWNCLSLLQAWHGSIHFSSKFEGRISVRRSDSAVCVCTFLRVYKEELMKDLILPRGFFWPWWFFDVWTKRYMKLVCLQDQA